jgi:hypothetical protein
MTDLTSELLPRLRDFRWPELDLGPDLITPHYHGGSILNLPRTFCQLLGEAGTGAQALMPEILDPLSDLASGSKNVVVILIDALALHRLQAWLNSGRAPFWSERLNDGLLAPLTSIAPSTTSTAVPTLWTGQSPAEHGMVGYELWLREYSVVANMITHSPFNVPGKLEHAGFRPEKVIAGPTLGEYLTGQGVSVHALQHFAISNSGMSRMFFRQGVQVHPFGSLTDAALQMRDLLESNDGERKFISLYWGEVDRLSHLMGPDSEYPEREFEIFSHGIDSICFSQLSAAARENTTVLLIADHGQINTQIDDFYNLDSHPGLDRRLNIRPTGENRLTYLHCRPGQVAAVEEYLQRTFMDQFVLLDPVYAIEKGFFGPGQPHPRLRDRVGDLIAVAKGTTYLWSSIAENPIVGRHGGLGEQEMLVPMLAIRP